jgi:hypothetical protein
MPEFGELDKLLIQDLLERKRKLEDRMDADFRYVGVALVLLIGFFASQKLLSHSSQLEVLGLSGVLCFLFYKRNSWLNRSLRHTRELLNQRLQVWSEEVVREPEPMGFVGALVVGAVICGGLLVFVEGYMRPKP